MHVLLRILNHYHRCSNHIVFRRLFRQLSDYGWSHNNDGPIKPVSSADVDEAQVQQLKHSAGDVQGQSGILKIKSCHEPIESSLSTPSFSVKPLENFCVSVWYLDSLALAQIFKLHDFIFFFFRVFLLVKYQSLLGLAKR
jgi:hypothetical protein